MNERRCKFCGEVLTRHTMPNGRLEGKEHFELRQYCNNECYRETLKLENIKSVNNFSRWRRTVNTRGVKK